VRTVLERVAAGVAAALRSHAHLLAGIQEVQMLLELLETSHPALVREAGRAVPAPVLAEVLRQLVGEGVSVKPLRSILEALLDAGARPTPALVEACRRALRRHIAQAHASAGLLDALLLDPALEQELRDALVGGQAALAPRGARALLDGLAREVQGRSTTLVLLTGPELRRPLRDVVAQRFPRLAVLSFEELPPELAVRPVGKLSAEAA
jgi:type III secretion protein V